MTTIELFEVFQGLDTDQKEDVFGQLQWPPETALRLWTSRPRPLKYRFNRREFLNVPSSIMAFWLMQNPELAILLLTSVQREMLDSAVFAAKTRIERLAAENAAVRQMIIDTQKHPVTGLDPLF